MKNPSTRILPLEGILNARELGGLPLRNGRQVKRGCLIRAGRLYGMTKEDQRILEQEWNVTDILDLRNAGEIAEYPDPALSKALFYHVPFFPGEEKGISKEEGEKGKIAWALRTARSLQGGGARRLLQEMYPDMVRNPYCLNGIREFFRLLSAHEEGALLWHCTSGKDRTGLSCALLLYVLGASWETIEEDYLLTNIQIQSYRDWLCEGMRKQGAEPDLIRQIYDLESVESDYLESCLSVIRQQYGSMDCFVAEILGLNEDIQETLLKKYTESKKGIIVF